MATNAAVAADLTEERVRGEKTAEYHDQYAEDHIDEKCLSLESPALRDCIHEQIEAARDQARAEQDLDAQQAMARFTKVMGYTAIVGIVLGAGSVVLIFMTLRATQDMARGTREIGEAQVRVSTQALTTVGSFTLPIEKWDEFTIFSPRIIGFVDYEDAIGTRWRMGFELSPGGGNVVRRSGDGKYNYERELTEAELHSPVLPDSGALAT